MVEIQTGVYPKYKFLHFGKVSRSGLHLDINFYPTVSINTRNPCLLTMFNVIEGLNHLCTNTTEQENMKITMHDANKTRLLCDYSRL